MDFFLGVQLHFTIDRKNFIKAFQHRAFSNAVVTQNRQKLSCVHIEVHVFENRRPAFVVVGKFSTLSIFDRLL